MSCRIIGEFVEYYAVLKKKKRFQSWTIFLENNLNSSIGSCLLDSPSHWFFLLIWSTLRIYVYKTGLTHQVNLCSETFNIIFIRASSYQCPSRPKTGILYAHTTVNVVGQWPPHATIQLAVATFVPNTLFFLKIHSMRFPSEYICQSNFITVHFDSVDFDKFQMLNEHLICPSATGFFLCYHA